MAEPETPLVWVTVGKTQHAALLLESGDTRCFIQWTSTLEKLWVDTGSIERKLSPRRRPSYGFKLTRSKSPTVKKDKAKTAKGPEDTPSSTVDVGTDADHQTETKNHHLDLVLQSETPAVTKTTIDTFESPRKRNKSVVVSVDRSDPTSKATKVSKKRPRTETTDSAHSPATAVRVVSSTSKRPAHMTPRLSVASSMSITTPLVASRIPPSSVRELVTPAATVPSDHRATTSTPAAAVIVDSVPKDLVITASTQTRSIPPPHSHQTSIYLQNLAEICDTILHDQRWYGLFQWNHGDDLSVAVALSRQYYDLRPRVPVSLVSGLECPEQAAPASAHGTPPSEPVVGDDDDDEETNADETNADGTNGDETNDLYLYARLFYRKGPWFRLDDIFHRYFRNGSDPATVLVQLLASVLRLQESGRIRGFSSEEECGKTVGISVLSAEERRTLLQKIGAPGKKQGKGGPNEVWKQMSRQRSLFSKSVLPVKKHVRGILLQALARTIGKATGDNLNDDLPPLKAKEVVTAIQGKLIRLVNEKFRTCLLCFRLREEPLLAVRRCARLYLCANSGPGEMRTSLTNGWKSLDDTNYDDSLVDKLNAPFPSATTWHHTQYPAMASTFGMQPALFRDAYIACPVNQKTPFDHQNNRLFSSRESFLRWEVSVELRAALDFLIEAHDTMRSDARRAEQGKSTVINTSIPDFMGLRTKAGRRRIVGKLVPDEMSAQCIEAIELSLTQSEDKLADDCEFSIAAIGMIALCVLHSVNATDVRSGRRYPWLRHLSWESCLAYILWDTIPVLERKNLYVVSIHCLQVLLFGTFCTSECDSLHHIRHLARGDRFRQSLLSRRAKGKSLDRLIIDLTHVHRARKKELEASTGKKQSSDKFQNELADLCRDIVQSAAVTSWIGFSAVRSLARRLKQPLSDSLPGGQSLESNELGFRLHNGSKPVVANKYVDWAPPIDRSVANAIGSDQSGVGGRCAFVGHEESAGSGGRSLNVEELAIEYYRTGRLPDSADAAHLSGGGWCGWHDEGGMLRSLFRILCSSALFGANGTCSVNTRSADHLFTFVTPYQGAPFDLHTGFQNLVVEDGNDNDLCEGFYARHLERIESFLERLRGLTAEDLIHLVHDSIDAQRQYNVQNRRTLQSLTRDLERARTLSAVAVGLGGQVLAAAFRCLLFDYRHYSGGLPDLLLLRASKVTSTGGIYIDFGDWIDEDCARTASETNASFRHSLFLDDEEFLGCNKNGDAAGNTNKGGWGRKKSPLTNTKNDNENVEDTYSIDTPKKLELSLDGDPVLIECLFVEVKSANDRLDPRQEDWLNVLDLHGDARVCKFESKSKKPTKRPSAK